MRILVVEDDPDLSRLLAGALRDTGYVVDTAKDGEEGHHLGDTEPYDAVILDLGLPEMDGITFLARAKELRPDAPRVILTGYADKENAIKAINQVGLYQYVEKPWDNDDIRLIIRNGLEKKQLLVKLTQKVSQINQAYRELQSIQQEILKAFA